MISNTPAHLRMAMSGMAALGEDNSESADADVSVNIGGGGGGGGGGGENSAGGVSGSPMDQESDGTDKDKKNDKKSDNQQSDSGNPPEQGAGDESPKSPWYIFPQNVVEGLQGASIPLSAAGAAAFLECPPTGARL